MGQTCAALGSEPVRRSVAEGLGGSRSGVRLGPSNGEAVRALHQGDASADTLDKFLVATTFDWIIRKEPNTNLTVGQDVELTGRGETGRSRGENPLEGMVEGAELTRVACGAEGAHPRSIGAVGDYRAPEVHDRFSMVVANVDTPARGAEGLGRRAVCKYGSSGIWKRGLT